MDFNYGIDYKKLPEYIKVAEEVIRGLGGAAAQETAIEEAQEVVEERTDEQTPPVDIVQFYTAMGEYGISTPGALLAADTADSIKVNHFENTVKLVPELSPEEEPTEE